MADRNKLSLRIPWLIDASAEGTGAIVALFSIILALVAVLNLRLV